MKKQTKKSMLYEPGKDPVEITPRSSKFTGKELREYLGEVPVIVQQNRNNLVMIVGVSHTKIRNRIGDILKNRTNPDVETKLIICKYDLVADIFE